MRRRIARTAALAAVGLVGCGSGTDAFPPACSDGPDAFQRALAAAPGPVRVDGTPISRCFARRDGAADIEALGTTLVTVAGRLADRAASDERAALELGYLVGAAERGAARTEGIHYELLRRLQQEPVSRSSAFRRGEAAGRRSG